MLRGRSSASREGSRRNRKNRTSDKKVESHDRSSESASLIKLLNAYFEKGEKDLLPQILEKLTLAAKADRFDQALTHAILLDPFRKKYQHAEKNVMLLLNQLSEDVRYKLFTPFALFAPIIRETGSQKLLSCFLETVLQNEESHGKGRHQLPNSLTSLIHYKLNYQTLADSKFDDPAKKKILELIFKHACQDFKNHRITVYHFLEFIQLLLEHKFIDGQDAHNKLQRGFSKSITDLPQLKDAVAKKIEKYFKRPGHQDTSHNIDMHNTKCVEIIAALDLSVFKGTVVAVQMPSEEKEEATVSSAPQGQDQQFVEVEGTPVRQGLQTPQEGLIQSNEEAPDAVAPDAAASEQQLQQSGSNQTNQGPDATPVDQPSGQTKSAIDRASPGFRQLNLGQVSTDNSFFANFTVLSKAEIKEMHRREGDLSLVEDITDLLSTVHPECPGLDRIGEEDLSTERKKPQQPPDPGLFPGFLSHPGLFSSPSAGKGQDAKQQAPQLTAIAGNGTSTSSSFGDVNSATHQAVSRSGPAVNIHCTGNPTIQVGTFYNQSMQQPQQQFVSHHRSGGQQTMPCYDPRFANACHGQMFYSQQAYPQMMHPGLQPGYDSMQMQTFQPAFNGANQGHLQIAPMSEHEKIMWRSDPKRLQQEIGDLIKKIRITMNRIKQGIHIPPMDYRILVFNQQTLAQLQSLALFYQPQGILTQGPHLHSQGSAPTLNQGASNTPNSLQKLQGPQ